MSSIASSFIPKLDSNDCSVEGLVSQLSLSVARWLVLPPSLADWEEECLCLDGGGVSTSGPTSPDSSGLALDTGKAIIC